MIELFIYKSRNEAKVNIYFLFIIWSDFACVLEWTMITLNQESTKDMSIANRALIFCIKPIISDSIF